MQTNLQLPFNGLEFLRLQIHLHFFLQPVGANRTGGFSNRIAITHNKPKSVAGLFNPARQDSLDLADTLIILRVGALHITANWRKKADVLIKSFVPLYKHLCG